MMQVIEDGGEYLILGIAGYMTDRKELGLYCKVNSILYKRFGSR